MVVESSTRLRELAHWGLDTGSLVHVRRQMAHVDALHLRCFPRIYSKTLTDAPEEQQTLRKEKLGLTSDQQFGGRTYMLRFSRSSGM